MPEAPGDTVGKPMVIRFTLAGFSSATSRSAGPLTDRALAAHSSGAGN